MALRLPHGWGVVQPLRVAGWPCSGLVPRGMPLALRSRPPGMQLTWRSLPWRPGASFQQRHWQLRSLADSRRSFAESSLLNAQTSTCSQILREERAKTPLPLFKKERAVPAASSSCLRRAHAVSLTASWTTHVAASSAAHHANLRSRLSAVPQQGTLLRPRPHHAQFRSRGSAVLQQGTLLCHRPPPHPANCGKRALCCLAAEDGGDPGSDAKAGSQKYLMVLAYDGTHFAGWQRQADQVTVQSVVEGALSKVTRLPLESLGLMVAGRTDAGVHASGQAVHFWSTQQFPDIGRTFRALNGVLPKTVRVRRLLPVPPTFHARHSPDSKTYHYTIRNASVHGVFEFRRELLFDRCRLDRGAMAHGGKLLVGTHDFSAFANASVIKDRDPVRTILRFDLVQMDSELFRFEIEGTGFLYKQVRNMVGLLIKIGRGDLDPSIVTEVLDSKSREHLARLAPCARPHGLSLHAVHYPSHFFANSNDWYTAQALPDSCP